MNNKVKAGDLIQGTDGQTYKVFDAGNRLQLWLISQPQQADNSDLAEQADYDATMDEAAGRGGY